MENVLTLWRSGKLLEARTLIDNLIAASPGDDAPLLQVGALVAMDLG